MKKRNRVTGKAILVFASGGRVSPESKKFREKQHHLRETINHLEKKMTC